MEKWRKYVRGGSVSDMMRLLAKDDTRRETRLARWVFMAGIVVAVAALAVATMRFFGG